VLADLGVDPTKPIVAFVGRITRQKGVAHLVAAAHRFAPDGQLVLCAGAPDTPEIAAEVAAAVQALAEVRAGVFWVREMLPTPKIREILSAATVFVCPSVYEPLGIVNLEAMACETAVVASDVGGIPEVVADQKTGLLVHYDPDDSATGRRDASAVSTNSPGRTSPSRRSTSIEKSPRSDLGALSARIPPRATALAGDALELVAESCGFVRSQFDDKTPATLQWYPHHDATPLLGCFQRTVAGPGLHRRHRLLPLRTCGPA
jgi:roadblock/LC7 domain-containing protein